MTNKPSVNREVTVPTILTHKTKIFEYQIRHFPAFTAYRVGGKGIKNTRSEESKYTIDFLLSYRELERERERESERK